MPTFEYENSFEGCVAGVDEVGRGPLVGPVIAAALIFKTRALPADLLSLIEDSKKVTAKNRKLLYNKLFYYSHIAFGAASVKEIDELNILRATMLAMRRALHRLPIKPDVVLVDGRDKPSFDAHMVPLIKGDALSYSIAAASIVAKVMRDGLMEKISHRYPQYHFQKHSGYGTLVHRNAINAHGPCPHHRMSFAPLKNL